MIRIYMTMNGSKKEIQGHACYTEAQAKHYITLAPAYLTYEVDNGS